MEKKRYKIVYIGAGSFRFTIPCALNILDFAKDFSPIELWLVDIDAESLALMDSVVKRMVYMHGKNITVHSTTLRKKALPGADYVLISISIGMQYYEWYDIHVPLKFGIPQNTGDTVGPGGIFRALRTIPVMVGMMKDIEELCPDATVLNYTNPQGTLVLASLQATPKVQLIGLCHEFFYVGTKNFGRFIYHCGVDTSTKKKFTLSYGGVNHFSWLTKIEYGGEDIYPQLREGANYGYESRDFHRPYNYYLLKHHGYFNYVEDRHVAEFLPQYFNFFNYKDEPFGIKLRRVDKFHKWRSWVYWLLNWVRHDRNYWFIKLILRPMEGGEKALLMVKDKLRNKQRHHVCNIMNNGTIPSLPDKCIVEVPCYFKDDKIQASKVGSLPSPINDWVKIHAENQQLVVNAALSGNPDDVLKALLADPMCQFIEDDEKIELMMRNLLYYEQKWLPNFSESIPSFKELKGFKYNVERRELSSLELAQKEKYVPDGSLKAKAWPQVI